MIDGVAGLRIKGVNYYWHSVNYDFDYLLVSDDSQDYIAYMPDIQRARRFIEILAQLEGVDILTENKGEENVTK
jgi:hypothetical protein